MAEPARKLQMKTTAFDFNGRPVTIGVFRKSNHGKKTPLLDTLWAVKAKNKEYGTSLTIVDLRILDFLLKNTSNWKEVREVFPCVAGAGLAYEAVDGKGHHKRLGARIIFAEEGEPRVIVPTGEYKGEKGIALTVPRLTADDIQLEKTVRHCKETVKDFIILANFPESKLNARLVVVPDFPSGCGWHMPHAKTGIPRGREVEDLTGTRYLRRRDSSYVGLPVRYGYYFGAVNWKCVDLDYWSSDGLGVAVIVPKGDIAKIEAPSRLDE